MLKHLALSQGHFAVVGVMSAHHLDMVQSQSILVALPAGPPDESISAAGKKTRGQSERQYLLARVSCVPTLHGKGCLPSGVA